GPAGSRLAGQGGGRAVVVGQTRGRVGEKANVIASPPRVLKFDFHLAVSNRLAAKQLRSLRSLVRPVCGSEVAPAAGQYESLRGRCLEESGRQDLRTDRSAGWHSGRTLEIARNLYSVHPELPGNL